jgi:copper homeostasis protein (lipoprotein)
LRTLSLGWFLMFLLAIAGGCASSGVPEQRALHLPVSYANRLPWPCADCPGLEVTVTLFPDSTFRLRRIYHEHPVVVYYVGQWSVSENGTRLALRSGTDPPQLFEIAGTNSLNLLDNTGRPIRSQLSYTLVHAPRVDPIRDTMRLRGLYTYMADAGRFTECLSRTTFPVAQAGANAALERAYGQTRTEPGAPVFVAVRGHFEERPAMEGDQRLQYLVVDSLARIRRGSCDEPM